MANPIIITVAVVIFLNVGESKLEGSQRSDIKLVDNGYEGILVAIGESVPESSWTVMSSHIEVRLLSTDYLYSYVNVSRLALEIFGLLLLLYLF